MRAFLLAFGIVMALARPIAADSTRGDESTQLSSSEEIRQAIDASLPFLEKKGVQWMGRRKCVSCHHTALLLWGYGEAERQGFTVDRNEQALWLDWSLTKQVSLREEDGDTVGSRNLEGLSQLILGSRRAPVAKEDAKIFERFRGLLLEGQQPDGLWKPMGQLPTQRRPLAETAAVSSMWALLALESFRNDDALSDADRTALDASRDRGLLALKRYDRGLSTEWWVLRMLIARQFESPMEGPHAKEALLTRQNTDGGWAWINGDPSDALATGLALYGLANGDSGNESPVATSSSLRAIERAQAFLLHTQEADGSWLVNSTKAKNKTEAIPTSIFLGTAWATIGLLQTLPEPTLATIR